MHSCPIVIIGMQRSGTSALSGALQKLGVYFGQQEMLYPPDANNPKGFFEHRRATMLNLRCLEAFQMHPTSFDPLPPDWKEHPEAESLRSELKRFIKEEFSKGGLWGIKQPLTSLVLPLYNDVFEELGLSPQYVLCVRNPLESMNSESRLDFGEAYRVMASLGKMAVGSWLRYTLGSFADATGHPLDVVGYENMLADPRSQLEAVVRRQPDWSPSAEQWESAVGSVQSGLRHNRSTPDDLNAFPGIVRKTYDTVLHLGPSDSREELFALPREFLAWTNILAEAAPIAGKLGLAWMEDGQPQVAETTYIPTPQWQTVRLTIDAPPRTPVSGLLYGLPCRAWIRRSLWHGGTGSAPATPRCGLGSTLEFADGIYRLDAVFEPDQIRFVTPGGIGPYELELEFLLETSPSISAESAARMARQLDECVGVVERLIYRLRSV